MPVSCKDMSVLVPSYQKRTSLDRCSCSCKYAYWALWTLGYPISVGEGWAVRTNDSAVRGPLPSM